MDRYLNKEDAMLCSSMVEPERTEISGDFIFRFKLDICDNNEVPTLEDYYKQHIASLLKIVRLYSKGRPVIIDSFSFLNNLQDQILIFDQEQEII